MDVAAGTSKSLNVVKKKGGRGQQGREIRGKKCIKNSLHKLAVVLAAKLTVSFECEFGCFSLTKCLKELYYIIYKGNY